MRTLARCRVASGFPGGVSCCGVIATVTLLWLVCASTICISAQTKEPSLSSLDRSTIAQMLKETNETVRKQYYDPTFHGADLDASYRQAQQAIAAATSVHQGYEAVEDFLAVLRDSHTHFIPPQQPFEVEQGWEMQMIGDKCLVTHVKEGSDAAAKGLTAGDRILVVDGVKPSRADWINLEYQLKVLRVRSGLHLLVASPGTQPKAMLVKSVVERMPVEYDLTTNDIWRIYYHNQRAWHRYEVRSAEVDNVAVLKLPAFAVKNEPGIDTFFHKAEKSPAVVIDLRGNLGEFEDLISPWIRVGGSLDRSNTGGAEPVLLEVLSRLFDHPVRIGDCVGRDKTKPLAVKGSGSHAYAGKVIVLIDGESASSAEIFARVMQLEKRGTVVGDSSAGAVRLAQQFRFVHNRGWGPGSLSWESVSVSVADLKMTDGKSLEGVGVTPDEVVLPTPEELAAGADPQMARALQLAGAPISAEKAGKLFPVEEQ
jgi:carboxyl-terminal processing protease